LPLYRTQMLKVVVLADGDTRGAALKGNSPVRDLGFRRLIPSLEQVTLKMPTVTSAGLVMQERGLAGRGFSVPSPMSRARTLPAFSRCALACGPVWPAA
jgi:hypothetical protein